MIVTDDQRFDTLWTMPNVQERLQATGVTFSNVFASSPTCCPFRASALSGGFYAQNTGVLTNDEPNGRVERFYDRDTIATRLQQEGWYTAIVGKYMNGYEDIAPYIPPGWTDFRVAPAPDSWTDYQVVEGHSTPTSPSKGTEFQSSRYITTFEGESAQQFLHRAGDAPFFIWLAFNAPHTPHTPLAHDDDTYKDFYYRNRAYNEVNMDDKPDWLQAQPLIDEETEAEADNDNQDYLECLLSVDRAIGHLLDTLEDLGRVRDTLVIFTSDNGKHFGEHRIFLKGLAYDESARIPLVVSNPSLEPRFTDSLVLANLDIGPTIFQLAGVDRHSDGTSLVPILLGD